jgi:threonine dehydrogenase-like Zn-dependent dehydrogenase
MRAFVVTAPGEAGVEEVPEPVAAAGEVVVDVERVGVCGTDVEFFTGEMEYLRDGHSRYPLRLGHEWCGTVTEVGAGVDAGWRGRRVTGDTMIGCGRCRRCVAGYQHVCDDRQEVGIRGARPGALAERLAVPASSLHALPDSVDSTLGALVEPGGNALRAVRAAALAPGGRLLVLGPGTIGTLVALFAQADGAEVHLLGTEPRSLAFARSLGVAGVWTDDDLPDLPFDASNAPGPAARAVELVEPGKRVVWIGVAGTPSLVDARAVVLKDVTAVGILSASPGLAETITLYAGGVIDPRPLVAATIALDDVAGVLAGQQPGGAGPGPKIHVDPRA